MEKREILLTLRREGKLKGHKPCFVYLKHNLGKIYNDGNAKFIMSLKDDKLYFQRLTLFNNIKESDDFSLNCKRFKEYLLVDKTISMTLILFDINGLFIEINYKSRRKDSGTTEDNIMRILDELKKSCNLKEAKSNDGYEEEADE